MKSLGTVTFMLAAAAVAAFWLLCRIMTPAFDPPASTAGLMDNVTRILASPRWMAWEPVEAFAATHPAAALDVEEGEFLYYDQATGHLYWTCSPVKPEEMSGSFAWDPPTQAVYWSSPAGFPDTRPPYRAREIRPVGQGRNRCGFLIRSDPPREFHHAVLFWRIGHQADLLLTRLDATAIADWKADGAWPADWDDAP